MISIKHIGNQYAILCDGYIVAVCKTLQEVANIVRRTA